MSKSTKHDQEIAENQPEEILDNSDLETSQSEGQEPEAAPEEPDYKEMYQRALADGENRRKRMEQDQKTLSQYALQSFVEDLLPVVDNFDRATSHVPADQQNSPWVTGIQYIQKNLLDVLENYGVKEISAKPGDTFDPQIHEALETQASDEYPDQTISQIQTKGYRLHDRVIRPVRVTVSSGPSQS